MAIINLEAMLVFSICMDVTRVKKLQTRKHFGAAKGEKNRTRDLEHKVLLQLSGWTVITVWECDPKKEETLNGKFQLLFDKKLADL